MSKKIKLMFITFVLIFSLTGCEEVDNFTGQRNTYYTGFDDIPEEYTVEEARNDGCIVMQGNKMISGRKIFDDFLNATTQEQAKCKIRIVQQLNGSDEFYMEDIIFNGSDYYMFNSTDPAKYEFKYKKLLQVTGMPENKSVKVSYVILTNEDEVSFQELYEMERRKNTNRKIDYQRVFFE